MKIRNLVPRLFVFLSLLGCLFLIWLSPYLMLSKVAEDQFGSDFNYVFPDYNVRTAVGEPESFCTGSVYDLSALSFLLRTANVALNISRPDTIPIHAAVYKGDDVYLWSFRNMQYVRVEEGTMTYNDQRWACEHRHR
jgi:hypothetical protein